MATLSDLARQMEQLEVSLPELMAKAKADAGRVMVNYLIEETPVDTSQALSNWKVAWGQPDRNTIGPYVPGKFGSTYSDSVQEAQLQAALILSSPVENKDLFISNNVDYIEELNDETSKSKQSGFFVERAEALVGQFIDNYSLKLPASL